MHRSLVMCNQNFKCQLLPCKLLIALPLSPWTPPNRIVCSRRLPVFQEPLRKSCNNNAKGFTLSSFSTQVTLASCCCIYHLYSLSLVMARESIVMVKPTLLPPPSTLLLRRGEAQGLRAAVALAKAVVNDEDLTEETYTPEDIEALFAASTPEPSPTTRRQ